jgi:hypothetical protein
MIVSKSLLINSPVDFYNFIRDKNHINDLSPDLIKFRDSMNIYINGCNCDKQEHFKKVYKIYQNLFSLDPHVVSELKKYGDCQKIIFNSNGVFLFEL